MATSSVFDEGRRNYAFSSLVCIESTAVLESLCGGEVHEVGGTIQTLGGPMLKAKLSVLLLLATGAYAEWLQVDRGAKFQCSSDGCFQLFVNPHGEFYFKRNGVKEPAAPNVAKAVLEQPDYQGNTIAPHRQMARRFYAARAPMFAAQARRRAPALALGSNHYRAPNTAAVRREDEPSLLLPEGVSLDTTLESLAARTDLDFFLQFQSPRNFACVSPSVGTDYLFQNGRFIEVNAMVTGRFPPGPSCDLGMNELWSGTDGVLRKFDCRVSQGVRLQLELKKYFGENGMALINAERPAGPDRDAGLKDVLAGRKPKELITLKRIKCQNIGGGPLTLRDLAQSFGSFIKFEIKKKI